MHVFLAGESAREVVLSPECHVLPPQALRAPHLPADRREPSGGWRASPARHCHPWPRRRARCLRRTGQLARLRRPSLRSGHAALRPGARCRGAAPVHPSHRRPPAVRPAVGADRLRGGDQGAACRARLRARRRARHLRHRPAPALASGSDRACDKWIEDYTVPGTDELALHHLDRAMTGVPIERVRWDPPWLGEELDAADGGQAHATPFAPRCVKDQIEEALFARRRDLFSELSIVFMDTTSLRFEGAGGESLGQRGHSKDHRPDLTQLILCVVIDAEGRPICTEIMRGNTADVRILLPTIDRLRHRFAIGRVCIVTDRGMISAATIEGLEERGLEYILGARERTDRLVHDVVLADDGPFTPLLVERANGAETQLFAKEVRHAGKRYIVCRNEAEAEKERADRQAIIAGL